MMSLQRLRLREEKCCSVYLKNPFCEGQSLSSRNHKHEFIDTLHRMLITYHESQEADHGVPAVRHRATLNAREKSVKVQLQIDISFQNTRRKVRKVRERAEKKSG